MADQSEIDRVLAQYGQGYTAPQLNSGDSEIYSTPNVMSQYAAQNEGVTGLLRRLATRVRGDSRPDNVLAGGMDTAANWLDARPRVGEDTIAPLGLAGMGLPFAIPGAVGAFGGALARTAPSPVDAARERAIQLGMEHLEDYRRRVANPDPEMGWRPGTRILTPDDIPEGRATLDEAARRGLDMSDRAKLERAYDAGYDLVVPGIHATNREPFPYFDPHAPSSHDAGHYGRGTYIINRDPAQNGPGYGATNPGYGEASYYGRNIYPMFVRRGNVLDLGNNTGDLTYPGHFLSAASKLEPLGLLTPEHKETLAALRRYNDILSTAEVRGPFSDGTYQANVRRPGVEGDEDRIYGVARNFGHETPLTTPELALETLANTLFREMGSEEHYWSRTALGSDGKPGRYLPNPIYSPAMDFNRFRTLEQMVMRDFHDPPEVRRAGEWRSGSDILTDAAKRAGYHSSVYGDEGVLFYPEGMRHFEAAFNPNTNSGNLLASNPAVPSTVGSILSQYGPPRDEERD